MRLRLFYAGFAVLVHGLTGMSLPAISQENAPPTFQGDPSVYKVLFEDKNFRVIDAVRKAGQHDKAHSHPLPSVTYFLTDCNDNLYDPTGNKRNSAHKAGDVVPVPVIPSHSTENISSQDCHQIFVERK